MEITVKYTDAAKASIDFNKTYWELSSKKAFYFLFILPALSVVTFVFGVIDYDGSFWILKTSKETTNYYNFHFFFGAGIVLIISSFVYVRRFFQMKKNFFKRINEIAVNHSNGTNEILIQMDNEFVSWQTSRLTQKMRWSLVSKFILFRNYIFLFTSDPTIPAIIIDRKLITENDFSELMALLKNHNIKSA